MRRPGGGWRWRHLEVTVAVSVGLSVTATGAWLARRIEQAYLRGAFESLATVKTGRVLEGIRNLRNTEIEGLARFFEHSEWVTLEEFGGYGSYLVQVPEVIAWGWVPAVPAESAEAFVGQVRATGREAFGMWEPDGRGGRAAPGARKTYYPVHLVASSHGLAEYGIEEGLDLGALAPVRAAMEEAARTRLTTSTDLLPSLAHMQGPGRQILIFRPVYDMAGERALRGFALAALDPDYFFRSFLGADLEIDGLLEMELYQIREDGHAEWLASMPPGEPRVAEPAGSALANGTALLRPVPAFG